MTLTPIPRFVWEPLVLSLFLGTASPVVAQPPSTLGTITLPGEYAMALNVDATRWLTVGERDGIRVVDNSGRLLSQWAQSAEFLDSRFISATQGEQRVFASFDSSQGHILLYSLTEQLQFTTEIISAPVDFPVEGLCLHKDNAQRLHLFLLSELFEARQYLLTQDSSEQWQMLPIRSLPTGPGTEFCAVDDLSATLFVSEAEQTLWAFSTNPEAEIERQLLDVASPFGNLGDGPRGLAATEGNLFVVSGDGPQLRRYAWLDGEFRAVTLSGNLAEVGMQSAESLNLSVVGSSLVLSLFDEDRSQFAFLQLAAEPRTQPATELPEVLPLTETTPMPQRGDAADDPALWIHPTEPSQSLVIGTNKRQGLFVYDLSGTEMQRLDTGRLNNVDIRYGAFMDGREVDIAVATNRDLNTLSLFAIDRETRQLSLVEEVPTPLQNIYGMCLYQSQDNRLYAFANDEDGSYLQYELQTNTNQWTGTLVRQFAVASQPEACVANDQTGQLFIGEEDVGIWTLEAEPDRPTTPQAVAMVGAELHDDVEGLALYQGETKTLLIASSQGNNSYVVMESAAPYTVLAAFRVGMNLRPDKMIDGASETDGLELISANLEGVYSAGILIVQDGRNVLPEQAQNFKLIPWRDVQALFPSM